MRSAMTLSPDSTAVWLSQAPSPAPVPSPAPTPWESIQGLAGPYAPYLLIAVALVILALIIFLILRSRNRRLALQLPQVPELPAETPQLKIELPPSEAEAARKHEAESAHKVADELAVRRRELADAARSTADAPRRAQLEAEARGLKEQEQEAKRAEYRARKAAEAEEKERHLRERQESERLSAEAATAAREAEAARARETAAEEARRVAAQSGQTLSQGLDKTRTQGFMSKLNSFLGGPPRQVDEALLGELEEILFAADIGVRTASRLVEAARDNVKRNELSSADKIKAVIRTEVERIVDLPRPKSLEGGGPPHVVMVVGVNGSGKTTTIGKLAAKSTAAGQKVTLAAGDTFRAAAAEQLEVWATRAGAQLVKGKEDSDPAAVIFDAIRQARQDGTTLVLADTAGRLHTQTPLMEELRKVKRVMDKALPGAPHEVLLVLDSTNGQNAIQQAKQFHEAVGVTAIALTKLDGTAKGGVIIGICDELKLPVQWVGVGEKIADLRPFDPKEFVAALFD